MPSSFTGSGLTDRSWEQESGRLFWKNRAQHLFFFLGYCVNMRTFSAFIYEDELADPKNAPSIIQIIIVCVCIGGPLLFLQMFIGQFTQKGCIAIGIMIPALYGYGYCMMIIGIFDSALSLHYSAGSLIYLFSAFLNFPYPTWMQCTDEMYRKSPNCFSRADMDLCETCAKEGSKPCFNPGKDVFSATLFRYVIAFEQDTSIKDPWNIGPPQTKSLIHTTVVIIFIYIVSCRKLKSLDLSLRISLFFCLLGLTVTMVISIAHKNFWIVVRNSGIFRIGALGDVTAWIAAFRRVTEALKISSGGHVLLGSYMTMDSPTHFRTLYLIGYYLLFIVIFLCQYSFLDILLQCRLNVPDYGLKTADDVSFIMLPTKLGLTASPQLWCTLYFTIYFLLSIASTVLQVVLIDETMSNEFKIEKYYHYTRCVICCVIFLLSLPLTTKGGKIIAEIMVHELRIMNLLLISVFFVIIFMYNIQRLKDDIHFVLNTPPTWYIETCWLLTAFISASVFCYQVWQYQSNSNFYLVRFPMYLLIGLPMIVGFIKKLIQYMKKKNITGLIRPSFYYGAPDLNTKLMRILYNPRFEVRYRRRKEVCKHRCLLNNHVIIRAIGKELVLLQEAVYDLSCNEEDSIEYRDIIAQLNEHHRIMHIRFAMLTRHAQPHTKLYSYWAG